MFEKAGARGRADGILTVIILESYAFTAKFVQIRRINISIAQRVNGIETLLIGGQP